MKGLLRNIINEQEEEKNLIEQTEPKTTSKLKFNKQTKKKGAKTDVYNVVKGGTTIGQVKWYSNLLLINLIIFNTNHNVFRLVLYT